MVGEGEGGNLPGGNPQSRRRQLGAELRGLRQGARMTAEQAGRELERSGSWISRVEAGKTGIRTRELHELLDVYGVGGAARRGALERLAVEGRRRAWWSSYRDVVGENYSVLIGLEDSAARIFDYQERVVPGLLQTEPYMRALLHRYDPVRQWALDSRRIERMIQVRVARQKVLGRDSPPLLEAVIDESVVRRMVGSPEVHRAQLQFLLRCAERVDLRVFSFRLPGGPAMVSSFEILRSSADEIIVFEENLGRSSIYGGPEATPYVAHAEWLLKNSLSRRESARLILTALDESGI